MAPNEVLAAYAHDPESLVRRKGLPLLRRMSNGQLVNPGHRQDLYVLKLTEKQGRTEYLDSGTEALRSTILTPMTSLSCPFRNAALSGRWPSHTNYYMMVNYLGKMDVSSVY